MKDRTFLRGVRNGIPIALGYLSVSFSFGIMAAAQGMTVWQAVLISLLSVTSAGQLAGLQIMQSPGQYMAMLLSQLTINLRYAFMGISLSQKTDERFTGKYRWLLATFITDEIFAMACAEENQDDASYLAAAQKALPENMILSERSVSWHEKAENGRTLFCEAEIAPLGEMPRAVWTEHMFIAEANIIE
jgi:predicted branched-subunit amino acid permease